MGPKTRPKSDKAIYNAVVPIEALTGSKLPSRGQMLGRLLFRVQHLKESKRESARNVVNESLRFWQKGGIPTQLEQNSLVKLEKLLTEWKTLKRSAKRVSEAHKAREKQFIEKLDDLFDIAHKDALTFMKIQEDKDFLA